ncbi:hypothetical protein PIPA1_48430 [Pelosinus sp. IPA-1]|nr:hypothetical protein PIPA1_48430 [Pelosinus sp. IPA-1]
MSILLFSILITIAANLDNLGVGIAYGVLKIKISHMANFTCGNIFYCNMVISYFANKIKLLIEIY